MEYLKSVRLQSESFLPSLDEEEELLMTDKQHIACSKNEDSCKKKRDKMVAHFQERSSPIQIKFGDYEEDCHCDFDSEGSFL